MAMKKRIDWWNLAFILFFIFLTYLAFELVMERVAPSSVSLWDTTIMAFAAFRLTRLVVYDSITRWVRDLFEDGQEYTFIGTLKTLINCPWCVGLWFALVVSTAFFLAPYSWFVIYVIALGGAASLIQVLANLIGWSAEHKKRSINP